MVQSLTLLRHGRTEFNAVGRFQGHVDVSLDSLGLAQAEAVGAYLARTGSITSIVSSDLLRTAQTADAVSRATGLPVHHDDALREITVGEWEGFTRDEVAHRWPDELEAWLSGVDMRPPGGESRSESSQRVHEAVLRHVEAADADANLLVVSHGAVIRGATELLLGMTDAPGHLGVLTNATYARLIPGASGGWVLREWGGGTESVAGARA